MSFWKKKELTDSVSTVSATGNWQSGIESTPFNSSANPHINSIEPLANRFGAIQSALSAGTVIQGKLSFDVPVRIDGKLTGELYSTQPVIVGTQAIVNATIEAPTVVVQGKVKGNILAKERIEIFSNGEVEGDLKSKTIILLEGSSLNGNMQIS